MDDLKNCPFDDGEAAYWHTPIIIGDDDSIANLYAIVYCKKCGASTAEYSITEITTKVMACLKARDAWNKRVCD